jgi:hypothetical protein
MIGLVPIGPLYISYAILCDLYKQQSNNGILRIFSVNKNRKFRSGIVSYGRLRIEKRDSRGRCHGQYRALS